MLRRAGILYYVVAIPLAAAVVLGTLEAEALQSELAARYSPAELADTGAKELLETLTFGLYHGARDKRRGAEAIEHSLARTERRVAVAAATLAVLTAGFLGGLAWAARRRPEARPDARAAARRRAAEHALGAATVFLAVGATAPILTIVAYQEVALVGRVVFTYETKSVLGTIGALYGGGNTLVAALLALFSLAVPAVKLGLSGLALALESRAMAPSFSRGAHAILHHLGRWSMTDVFVVAVLVAFLTSEKAEATEAHIGLGLYFFAAHTVLAVAAGMLSSPAAPR